MRYDPEVQRIVSAYQLGLPRMPATGRSGELLGRGTGTSLEFQEFREYMPGDDIRHLDWAAYARSDSLMVRLYREEISPRMEILVDASKSMAAGEQAKSYLARQLASVFALLSGALGGQPAIRILNDERPLPNVGSDGLALLETIPFAASSSLAGLIEENQLPLKKQAVRVVLSDFLFPHDPQVVIRRLAADSSALWVIQILNAWEADPTPLGGRHLVDVETGAETDLIINKAAIDEYRKRLNRLQEELARHCRRVHATFVTLKANYGLANVCRDELSASGILRAA